MKFMAFAIVTSITQHKRRASPMQAVRRYYDLP